MKKILAGHQPDMLPYELFWRKIRSVDTFIIVTTYGTSNSKNSFQNRQRILNWGAQPQYLTIPCDMGVNSFNDTLIKEEVRQAKGLNWREHHLLSIRMNYGFQYEWTPENDKEQLEAHRLEKKTKSTIGRAEKEKRPNAPFFEKHYPAIEKIYRAKDQSLGVFNKKMIDYFLKSFNIDVPVITSDGMDLDVSFATEIDNAVQQKGALNCENEIRALIEWLRNKDPGKKYRLDIDEATRNVMEECFAVQNGQNTSLGEKKEFKLDATAKLIMLLQQTNHDIYLSGAGSEVYVIDALFHALDKENLFFRSHLKEYSQIHSPNQFIPYMCGLDILFNCGQLP